MSKSVKSEQMNLKILSQLNRPSSILVNFRFTSSKVKALCKALHHEVRRQINTKTLTKLLTHGKPITYSNFKHCNNRIYVRSIKYQ